MAYQRNIEAAMHQGWQSKFGNSQELPNAHPKPKQVGQAYSGMLREDSAYEMYPGYRSAIKKVNPLWDRSPPICESLHAAQRHSPMHPPHLSPR